MPSLALIFHLVNVCTGDKAGPVSLKALEAAILYCKYLLTHARKVYLISEELELDKRHTLLSLINEKIPGRYFSSRDIYRKNWKGFTKPEEVKLLLNILFDEGKLGLTLWKRGQIVFYRQ